LPGSFDCLGERGHAVKAAAGSVAVPQRFRPL